MKTPFLKSYSTTIISYIGISFITGAIAHGFFSGFRTVLTGVFGILLFTIGAYLEGSVDKKVNWNLILSGAFLAIGIGAVTGGLQHFPDSPERSLWILPVGAAISLWFYAKNHEYIVGKKEIQYMFIIFTMSILLSLSLYGIIEYTGMGGHSHMAAIDTHK